MDKEVPSIYPVMDNVDQVIEYIESHLPITTKNQAISLLVLYRNTLIKQTKPCASHNLNKQ